jgi:hypothetical protein
MDLAIERTKEINKGEYNEYLPLMERLKTDIDQILFNFLNIFANSQDIESLLPDAKYNFKYDKVIHLLWSFIYFIYKKDGDEYTLLPLDEQNENARNYIHFDFSMKKPKTL